VPLTEQLPAAGEDCIREIYRLRETEPQLTRRQIGERIGRSLDYVCRVLGGEVRPKAVTGRCPKCRRLVNLPCIACRVEAFSGVQS
jgi:hypothetical protein